MIWLRTIAAFAFALAFVCQPATSSAFVPASPGTRVGASEVVAGTLVGGLGDASRGQHQGIGAAYDETASGYRFAARGAEGLAARFDPSRAGHIFREAAGHVNPASAASQGRFARLFEQVASNPANLRADAVQAGLLTQQAAEAGVQAFTWTGRTGQVWVTIRNGVVQNAGVNPLGAFR